QAALVRLPVSKEWCSQGVPGGGEVQAGCGTGGRGHGREVPAGSVDQAKRVDVHLAAAGGEAGPLEVLDQVAVLGEGLGDRRAEERVVAMAVPEGEEGVSQDVAGGGEVAGVGKVAGRVQRVGGSGD